MGRDESDKLSNETLASYWRSLVFFSIYRLIIAILFLLAIVLFGSSLHLGEENFSLFRKLAWGNLLVASGLLLFLKFRPYRFNLQLTIQVALDVILLTLIMYVSGGQKSGVAVLILVVVAGAGLVGQGRLTLFYAALATVAVLLEQGWRTLTLDADPGDFVRTGIICLGFFGTAIVARLLSERVIANERLARERGRELDSQRQVSERIVNDMAEGVLVVDAAGVIHLINPRARRLLEAQNADRLLLSELSSDLAERFATWSRGRTEVEDVLRQPGGRLLRLRYLPPQSDEGKALVYIEDMEHIEYQAQQLKLAALGRLTANLAHEIRNPLSAISHAAELLAEEEKGPVHQRLARIVHGNTLRLDRLVTEVLELGKRDTARVEKVRWSAFLREFMDELVLHDASAALRIKIGPNDCNIWFDRGHLYQVLWNLANNALRHASSAVGAVMIDIRLLPASNQAEIQIADDGPGVPEDMRAQVFEPFFTTHGAGTGLGLYIARELCEANGARIGLSDSERGARFCITAKGEACSET